MQTPVYLDNHATTQVDPRVVKAMLPWFTEEYGNPASRQHAFGWRAEAAVDHARAQVARLIGADRREIVFTSGATESINLALKGIVLPAGGHVVTSAVEHRAVLDTCRSLEAAGVTVTIVPVDGHGLVDPQAVAAALTPRTVLVSIMSANNEVGTLEPVDEIGRLCAARGICFHVDAAQSLGRVPVDVQSMLPTAMTGSAHKMHGPKGVGFLYLRSTRPRMAFLSQIDGGGHESGRRSGTLNVPGIVGLGEAASLAAEGMENERSSTAALRDRLVTGITGALRGVHVNGHPVHRLPNNASMTFDGVRADRLMMDMKDLAVSAGSACSSAEPGPSHVLLALGLERHAAESTLRFGLSRFTTADEIEYAIRRVVETVAGIRSRTPKLQTA
jgi:cysteine desulfurase